MRGGTRFVIGVLLVALLGMGRRVQSRQGESLRQTRQRKRRRRTRLHSELANESLYDETIGSVVTIQVVGERGQGLGSGFVYDEGHVVPDSPADGVLQGGEGTKQVGGLEVRIGGDVILAIDGQRIDSGEDLSSYLTQTSPGETVTLTILRDGERMQVEVTLGERPPPGEEL